VNGKIYIGKTVQNFERRCQAHRYESCTALNNSINVHGWDNFDKEIICNALDEKHLAHLEEYFIKLFNSIHTTFSNGVLFCSWW
jgi:predicted GIY-YIG superfamily endonuclease